MPVDEAGNRADIVMDSGSTTTRMNLGRLYEQYIGAAARDMRKKLQQNFGYTHESKSATIKKLEGIYKNNNVLFKSTYEYLLGFLNIISPVHHDYVNNLNVASKIEYMADILSDNLYLFYPVENPREPMEVIKGIEKYSPPTYGPVSYVGNSGNRVTTKRNVRIGPLYIMLLEKIADDWSAVAYGKLHHFGMLATMTKSEKYTYPFHNNPVRTIGETEGRVYSGYCGREAIAEMMDRANSPVTQKSMAWNILNAAQPTNIPKLIDRSLINYGGSKPLQLLNHISICCGWKPVYKPEEK